MLTTYTYINTLGSCRGDIPLLTEPMAAPNMAEPTQHHGHGCPMDLYHSWAVDTARPGPDSPLAGDLLGMQASPTQPPDENVCRARPCRKGGNVVGTFILPIKTHLHQEVRLGYPVGKTR